MDLLGMAGRLRCLPIVVSCSTRDELDAVCSALSTLSHTTIAALVISLSTPFSSSMQTFPFAFKINSLKWLLID